MGSSLLTRKQRESEGEGGKDREREGKIERGREREREGGREREQGYSYLGGEKYPTLFAI